MTHASCPGYGRPPYRSLVAGYPGEEAYPRQAFRTEWGPVFHRGRLDGTARLLVVGQDPATHEAVTRRVLAGPAGLRVQGFLSRLGLHRSYVVLNTYLYSVYGQHNAERYVDEPLIRAYRERWFAAVLRPGGVTGVLTLGHLADHAYRAFAGDPPRGPAYATVLHPTYPEAAAAAGAVSPEEAWRRLVRSWNAALPVLADAVAPDAPVPLVPYSGRITVDDLQEIPEEDLPAGLPAWMRGRKRWADRTGADPLTKRSTLTVRVPDLVDE